MTDAYHPPLDGFALTTEEAEVVAAALLDARPWHWKANDDRDDVIKAVKKKIQDLQLERHDHQCCYCRRDLRGAGRFMIDREHVLPKSVEAFRALSFTIWNLGASCKRCNMQCKGERVDFVVDAAPEAWQDGANYLLIHPNFDDYHEHIDHVMVVVGRRCLQKFGLVPGSTKAAYTYDFFALREMEVGSFDEAQGRPSTEGRGPGAIEAAALAARYGQ